MDIGYLVNTFIIFTIKIMKRIILYILIITFSLMTLLEIFDLIEIDKSLNVIRFVLFLIILILTSNRTTTKKENEEWAICIRKISVSTNLPTNEERTGNGRLANKPYDE